MDVYRIAFIGHRQICGQYHLEDEITKLVLEKLHSKEYVELYVGRNGDFDILAASAVKKRNGYLVRKTAHSCFCSLIQ